MEFKNMEEVFLVLALVILAIFLVSIILYVIQAIALSTIAKNNGYENWWIAWIPIANSFLIPILVKDDVHESVRGNFILIYGITFVGSALLSGFIPFAGIFLAALNYYAFYILANWYSKNAVAHLIIGVVTFGLSIPFSLLRFRNRERISDVV